MNEVEAGRARARSLLAEAEQVYVEVEATLRRFGLKSWAGYCIGKPQTIVFLSQEDFDAWRAYIHNRPSTLRGDDLHTTIINNNGHPLPSRFPIAYVMTVTETSDPFTRNSRLYHYVFNIMPLSHLMGPVFHTQQGTARVSHG